MKKNIINIILLVLGILFILIPSIIIPLIIGDSRDSILLLYHLLEKISIFLPMYIVGSILINNSIKKIIIIYEEAMKCLAL